MAAPAPVSAAGPPSLVTRIDIWRRLIAMRYQFFLDYSAPLIIPRWVATAFLILVYLFRVYLLNGWYIVTYALGIYILNLLIGFLSPKIDPESVLAEEGDADKNAGLPTSSADEFKPFIRRLPEFKFWHSLTRAVLVALFCTFFSIFDIPVFWPILLMYFLALFAVTMKNQIRHMIKHKYIPFSFGKPKYKATK